NLFFQAEDGIRDFHVTGVQTCALPNLDVDAGNEAHFAIDAEDVDGVAPVAVGRATAASDRPMTRDVIAEDERAPNLPVFEEEARSEERRVGKVAREGR